MRFSIPANLTRSVGRHTQTARKIAGGRNEPINPLDDRAFPEHPLYNGDPWFLPMIGAWYRTRDWIDRRLAG